MLFKNTQSFEKIFREYYADLVVFSNKFVKDLEASDDIIQELFISLYEKNNQIELTNGIKPYLFKAAYNRCISYLRETKPIPLDSSSNDAIEEFRDILQETEFESHIYAEIQKLPNRCREVFVLSRFKDLSNDEIANKLNISKRTVETQISKALKTLRSTLDPKTFYIFFM